MITIWLYTRSRTSLITTSDEFEVYFFVLNNIVENYANIVLIPKINHLKSLYDLKRESPTNSIKTYLEKKNKIIADSTIEIMKLLSFETREYLTNKYSSNGLALLIQNRLKQQTLD
jgi:hypothetical protein